MIEPAYAVEPCPNCGTFSWPFGRICPGCREVRWRLWVFYRSIGLLSDGLYYVTPEMFRELREDSSGEVDCERLAGVARDFSFWEVDRVADLARKGPGLVLGRKEGGRLYQPIYDGEPVTNLRLVFESPFTGQMLDRDEFPRPSRLDPPTAVPVFATPGLRSAILPPPSGSSGQAAGPEERGRIALAKPVRRRGELDERAAMEVAKNPALTHVQLAAILECNASSLRNRKRYPLLAKAMDAVRATRFDYRAGATWRDRSDDA